MKIIWSNRSRRRYKTNMSSCDRPVEEGVSAPVEVEEESEVVVSMIEFVNHEKKI